MLAAVLISCCRVAASGLHHSRCRFSVLVHIARVLARSSIQRHRAQVAEWTKGVRLSMKPSSKKGAQGDKGKKVAKDSAAEAEVDDLFG